MVTDCGSAINAGLLPDDTLCHWLRRLLGGDGDYWMEKRVLSYPEHLHPMPRQEKHCNGLAPRRKSPSGTSTQADPPRFSQCRLKAAEVKPS